MRDSARRLPGETKKWQRRYIWHMVLACFDSHGEQLENERVSQINQGYEASLHAFIEPLRRYGFHIG